MLLKRDIGDTVRINPYDQVTGKIIERRDNTESNLAGFDYKVKLFIPYADKDDINYFDLNCNYNSDEDYFWQFFNDEELDRLERNYEMVTR